MTIKSNINMMRQACCGKSRVFRSGYDVLSQKYFFSYEAGRTAHINMTIGGEQTILAQTITLTSEGYEVWDYVYQDDLSLSGIDKTFYDSAGRRLRSILQPLDGGETARFGMRQCTVPMEN